MMPTLRGQRLSIAVLVPAHDEEIHIGKTVAALRAQLHAGDRLLVVADNCSDRTAELARQAGAEVSERCDPTRRGKGYALDHGMRVLAQDTRDVVIFIDADCIVEEGAFDILAQQAWQSQRPVQALVTMHSSTRKGGSPGVRVAEFAWLIKNLVRPLGYQRVGLPCHLMGTGMAFPWALLSKVKIASGHLVEDMKLGIDMTDAGTAPLFCPAAHVRSDFAVGHGAKTQRTRWEHGHLGMIFSEAPRAFLRAIRTGNVPLLALVADMAVPPLALLMLLAGGVFVVSVLLAAMTEDWGVAIAAGVLLMLLFAAIMLAWWRFGRQVLGLSDLVFAVWYAIAKIPLYLRFIFRRQVEWVRTEREP